MVTAAERMVAINPNAAYMLGSAGFWLCRAGARTAYERLLELKPDFSGNARDYVGFFVLDDQLADKMLEGLDKAISAVMVEQESG